MVCERCKKKKAAMVHRMSQGGHAVIRHLCAECSEVMEATGELEDVSAVLPPYIAPMVREEGGCFPFFLVHDEDRMGEGAKGRAVRCPICGMSAEELLTTGRAGCAGCYETFAAVVAPIIELMNGGAGYVGQLPSAARERKERQKKLEGLRDQLRGAVASEQYELAAALRDEIRALESTGAA